MRIQFRGDGCRATGDVVVRENGRFEGRHGDADASALASSTDAPAVRSHISSLGAPRFVELSETHFSCVDGRYPQGVVTTAGGDAAEFMLALTAAKSFGAPVDSQRVVSELFAAFLDYSPPTRRFYMHSDTQAHARLCRKLGLFDGPECDTFNVRHAQPDMQEVLRFQLVANVSHIGYDLSVLSE